MLASARSWLPPSDCGSYQFASQVVELAAVLGASHTVPYRSAFFVTDAALQ